MSNSEGHSTQPADGDFYMTPSGRLYWRQSPFDRCFNQSMGSGLLALATAEWPTEANKAAFFIRTMMKDALTRFAHSCSENQLDDTRSLDAMVPDPAQAAKMVLGMPPVKGGEYLSATIIIGWHKAFRDYIKAELEQRRISAAEWLQGLGEPWNRIGKVFFHLAENRDDQTGSHPFAFLATFAHKSSAGGELSHLPLGRAAQLYHDDHRALLALLQPLKEASKASRLLNTLLENQSIYTPMAWDSLRAQDFLRDIPAFEEAGIIVRMVNLWKKPPKKLQLAVTAEQTEDNEQDGKRKFSIHSILSFSVAASLGGRRLSPEEIETLLASDGGLLRFNGEWVDVDSQKIRQLLDRWQQAVSMMNKLGIPLIQGLRLLVNGPSDKLPVLPPPDPDCQFVMGKQLGTALQQLAGDGNDRTLALPAALSKTLRPYQTQGVSFLDRTTSSGFGACLADDMGLGKTLQCLAWLSHLKASGDLSHSPALIIAPASLLGNWLEEILRFTPELHATMLHPSNLSRHDWRQLAAKPGAWLQQYDAVISSYGMATRLDWLPQIEFSALVLDEAQAVKNADSQRATAIRNLQSPRKVALSGTPVENSLNELWSLMEILNPGLLGGKKEFDRFVKGLDNDFSSLRKLTHPFILRRMKTDPALVPDLPDKSDIAAYCSLTPKQAALYKSQVNALHAALEEPDPSQRLMLILPFLARFKQICNHPSQFLGRGDYDPEESGKFMRLKELASQIAERQEKLIIFTQFRSMMDPLHSLLADIYHRPGLMLHGDTPIPERQQLVSAFQKEEGPPFFVLSLKAAGTGLTLTQANHVIHFDRWWNPAVENQATDRAYRIGQHRNVLVHRLICTETIEDKIDHLLRQKQELADSLFEGGVEKLLINMNTDEIRELIQGF